MEYEVKTYNRIIMLDKVRWHGKLGRLSPDQLLYFHHIPKNASSFMSGILDNLGWSLITSHDQIPRHLEDSRGICFLRDPIKRWISGITQFLFLAYDNGEIQHTFDSIMKILYRNPDMDNHTAPQSSFLLNYDLEWFDYHFIHEIKGVNSAMSNYLNLKSHNIDITNYEWKNTTNENQSKNKIRALIKQKLQSDEDFVIKLKQYYNSDYALIDWVGRNNKWIPSI